MEPGKSDKAPTFPRWFGPLALLSWFGLLLWGERRSRLRRPVEDKLTRDARNLAVAGASAAVIQGLEMPVVRPLAKLVERRRWGLTQRLPLPEPARVVLAVVLMDYTLYLWHVLTHRVPFLWRFHQVHHIDRDLDASTAIRFHFGEMAMSVPFRATQILVIGTSPQALEAWQTLLFASILFHHSNVRLPLRFERWIAHLVVTPRLHGIHHSTRDEEVNSNWSSGLTVWDWLHGTLRTDVPQEEITIGVPGFDQPEQVTLPKIMALPFHEQGETPHVSSFGTRQPLTELQP
jgi:sterol desaturase/sphingolipid hydroxylase (fatty acid hydroxylase superfamily)